jgi:outer membrane immunogenic protein
MKIQWMTAALSGAAISAGGFSYAGGIAEPVPEPIIQPAPIVMAYNWSGGYAGLQFGLIDSTVDNNVGIFDDDYEFGSNVDGTAFGFYGGYNWQASGPWVFGAEVEYNWVNADNDASVDVAFGGEGVDAEGTAQIDATGALRGRVGYAVGRALLYGAAGIAYIDYEVGAKVDGRTESKNADDWGYTVGLGVDYAFTDKLIGRLDYRYSNFDGVNGNWFQGDASAKYDIDLDTNEVRLGLAYRF